MMRRKRTQPDGGHSSGGTGHDHMTHAQIMARRQVERKARALVEIHRPLQSGSCLCGYWTWLGHIDGLIADLVTQARDEPTP